MNKLFLDIETSPLVVESWNLYPNAISHKQIRQHRAILCAAWKWENEEVEYTDEITVSQDGIDDTANCNNLWHVLNEREDTVVVMHNGDKFDLPIIRTHLLKTGFPPIQPLRTIDTLKEARKHFRFESNRLDYLGQFLGLGGKYSSGYELWQRVMQGEPEAMAEMVDYNCRDVLLLEEVYNYMSAYYTGKLFTNQIQDAGDPCPRCGSTEGHQSRGWGYNTMTKYRRYQCKNCHAWNRGTNISK